ncbi:unnamed protein product [Gongylonema pulchrum]|uniref:Ovule protein n=1 Tax=Gongylonema pulchrum TaxID=637853 RepID=A0A183CYI2_9BILA|nr:unnamed protein product [Gongylonema pulchrum]
MAVTSRVLDDYNGDAVLLLNSQATNLISYQNEARMEDKTVSHEKFKGETGEHYPSIKPRDSNILCRDESFVPETLSATEYIPKKGERHDVKRPGESSIWKVSGLKFSSFGN